MTVGISFIAGGLFTAGSQERMFQGLSGATTTTVTSVAGTIAGLNYNEAGATVDGFLIGSNVLLTFGKPVCGGIGTLGKVGDNITYSGVAVTYSSGFQTVHVTSFTNGSITYPPPAPAKPAAYSAVAGSITQLNYSDFGFVDGFLFTPSSGSPVFVNVGMPSSTLAPLLKVGAAVTVTGMLEPAPQCAATGTVSEVDATSLTIGSTAYPISGGMGMGGGFGFGRRF
jgi:hypothetical protein